MEFDCVAACIRLFESLCSGRKGRAHKDWYESVPVQGKCFDLAHAYKQLVVKPVHQKYTGGVVWDASSDVPAPRFSDVPAPRFSCREPCRLEQSHFPSVLPGPLAKLAAQLVDLFFVSVGWELSRGKKSVDYAE
eukprot:3161775-Amphidinium_carterae.1